MTPPARDMDAWVSVLNGKWHQAVYRSHTGAAILCCSGAVVRPHGVMDYRWRPRPWDPWCRHRACRREVAP